MVRGGKSARGRGGMFGHPYRNKPFPFDITLCADAFPSIKMANDADAKLSEAILEAAKQLTPTDKERAELSDFVNKVKEIIEKIRSTTDADYLPGVVLEEVHEVGSYKKDTALRGHRVADLVVVTKSMPTFESVASMGQKLCSELTGENGVVSMVSRDFGLILTRKEDKVRLLVSTVQSNTAGLEKDLHLSYDVIAANQAAIYHARCFEEFGSNAASQVRPLVRVFKAMRRRFPGLEPINIWALESLTQYCIITTPSAAPLSVGTSFKRVLSQLAAGIFLPGSSGLSDPVDHRYRLCDQLTYEDMDTACSTAQTLLRILCHGGVDKLLGKEDTIPDLARDIVYMADVVVAPLEKAYVGGEEEEEEEGEGLPELGSMKMETQ